MASNFWESMFGGLGQGFNYAGQNLLPYLQQKEAGKRQGMLDDLYNERYEAQIATKAEQEEYDRRAYADKQYRGDIQSMIELEDTRKQDVLDEKYRHDLLGQRKRESDETKRYHDLIYQGKKDDIKSGKRILSGDWRKSSAGKVFSQITKELIRVNAGEIPEKGLPQDPNDLRVLLSNPGAFDEIAGTGYFDDDDYDKTNLMELVDEYERLYNMSDMEAYNLQYGSGGNESSTDSWGRGKYGNQWDELTAEQKQQLYNGYNK